MSQTHVVDVCSGVRVSPTNPQSQLQEAADGSHPQRRFAACYAPLCELRSEAVPGSTRLHLRFPSVNSSCCLADGCSHGGKRAIDGGGFSAFAWLISSNRYAYGHQGLLTDNRSGCPRSRFPGRRTTPCNRSARCRDFQVPGCKRRSPAVQLSHWCCEIVRLWLRAHGAHFERDAQTLWHFVAPIRRLAMHRE